MEQKVVIIGAGGFAREVLDIIDACNAINPTYDMLGYIVESRYASAGTIVNDRPILGDFDWLEKHPKEVSVTCAVGAPHQRYRLIQMAKQAGAHFFNIIHPTAVMTRWITLGTGVVITAGCIFTNQIRVGNHVHVNLDCTIGHDVVIEDYVTLAPGVHVSGNVVLAEGCNIGTGANIIEKTRIGEWSIVGAGSTIVSDVPANTTVVGVPGKVIKTREAGWYLHNENEH